MKQFLALVIFSLLLSLNSFSQIDVVKTSSGSFIDLQKSFPKPGEAFLKKEDTLRKQFIAKNLTWPARYIYIRSFKYDSQLEVWVKQKIKDSFTLFKTYKVCALAGTLGPKRMEGDYQVPEGFYYINEFNPRSNYRLSLGLNYPNSSDRILSDSLKPGGEIYIHGSCVTTGCIPITDDQIDELYVLSSYARASGQEYIPVHVFPIRFNVKRSVDYLANLMKDDVVMKRFEDKLEDGFDYFEKYRQVPVVLINNRGEYIIHNAPGHSPVIDPSSLVKPVVKVVEKKPVRTALAPHRTRKLGVLPDVVSQWPQFPGGSEEFMRFLKKLESDLVPFLPLGTWRAYVQVEYVVDYDGTVTNIKVVKGINDFDFIDALIERMENMPKWAPALLNNFPVAKKLVQTVIVSK